MVIVDLQSKPQSLLVIFKYSPNPRSVLTCAANSQRTRSRAPNPANENPNEHTCVHLDGDPNMCAPEWKHRWAHVCDCYLWK